MPPPMREEPVKKKKKKGQSLKPSFGKIKKADISGTKKPDLPMGSGKPIMMKKNPKNSSKPMMNKPSLGVPGL